jgi:uncharacterized protein (DUF1684 family)
VIARADLWDWRRRIGELYAEVRRAADPEEAWRQWRAERDRLFATHVESPLEPEQRDRFDALRYFAYDPALRLFARLVPAHVPSIEVTAGADGTMTLETFARTEGLASGLGRELTLYWIAGYGGGVFLPFGDASNGRGSYGGGRYLLDTIKGADLGSAADGRVVLDFNFSYNPSCAYSPRWICPLAPPENRLSVAVQAGETIAAPAEP